MTKSSMFSRSFLNSKYKIDGHYFHLVDIYQRKSEAQETAEEAREEGYYARISKVGDEWATLVRRRK